jgi:hypothetical protein
LNPTDTGLFFILILFPYYDACFTKFMRIVND